ncbi:MAG: efflux RND transporter periplasmic adaptor subunit [Prevotella sp.]|nr:efflux RND transporter periplasmic adaptor subunit [Prevotella sp.]
MKNKSAIGTVTVCGLLTVGLLAAPKMVLKSVPTATVVKVEKVERVDAVSLSGTIMKNLTKDETYVQTYVPEQDISKVEPGQTAEITGEAFPGIVFSGTVDKISDTASKVQFGNVQKTAVEVKIKIDDPDEILKQGYTASVQIITSEPDTVSLVPYEAVDQDDNGEFVYVLRDGKAEKLYIETGAELSGGIELKTPVYGEKIITLDELVENGAAVRLSEQEQADD